MSESDSTFIHAMGPTYIRLIGVVELEALTIFADVRRSHMPLKALSKQQAIESHLKQLCAEYALSGLLGSILMDPGQPSPDGQQVPVGKRIKGKRGDKRRLWCAVCVRKPLPLKVDTSGLSRLWLSLPASKPLPQVAAVMLSTVSKSGRGRLVKLHGWCAPMNLSGTRSAPYFATPQHAVRVEDLHSMSKLNGYLQKASIALIE